MEKSEIAYESLGIVTRSTNEDGKLYQYAEFESLYEFQDKIMKGVQMGIFTTANRNLYDDEDKKWRYGAEHKTLEATREAMEYGHTSEKTLLGVEQLREALLNKDSIRDLQYKAKTMKRQRVFSEAGAELDIDRVLCGDPQHWQKTTTGKKTNVLRLGVNLAINGGFREPEIQQIASYGAVTCELLSMAGFNVELYAMYIGGDHTNKVVKGGAIIKLKAAEEKMDIQRICGLGIIGVFRAFVFMVIGDVLDGQPRHGYGHASGLDERMTKMLDLDCIIDSHSTQDSVEINIGKLLNLEKL